VDNEFVDLVMPMPNSVRDFQLSEDQRTEIEQQLGLLATDWHNLDLQEALEKHGTIVPTVDLGEVIEASSSEYASLIFRDGFGTREDWGRWTIGHHARFVFRVASAGNAQIWVEIALVSRFFLAGRAQVLLKVNGGAPQLLLLSPSTGDQKSYAGFLCDCRDGLVDCTIFMPHTKQAFEEPLHEPRDLGLGFVSITPRAVDQY
jgi:hypothetical protein